ncbi:hypothetical protein PRJ_1112 [Pseudomonas sp. XWY-1]|nr:hypothetical protein PRJ_1112 [Pseudomonas sp. XWY-1]
MKLASRTGPFAGEPAPTLENDFRYPDFILQRPATWLWSGFAPRP